jgi:alkylated DNA repair dioxygenase AlkB
MIVRGELGDGDSFIIQNILSGPLSERCLNIQSLEDEIQFHDFYHKGKLAARKVAIQGECHWNYLVDVPLYRTPGDHRQDVLPWSPIVNEIRRELSSYFHVTFNHVKMQLYRDGNDYITKHSDKTLDIKRGSAIVNLNLGTTRYFTIQNKTTGEIQNYEFPHNTVFVLGWRTNINWTHCVNKDPNNQEKRISLVFRQIATWMTPEGQIYGQGGRRKTKEGNEALEIPGSDHNQEEYIRGEARLMLEAFSRENRLTYEGEDLDGYWESLYGRGFDSTDLSSLL